MKAIEIARLVKAQGVHVFRERKGEPGTYDAKPFFTGSRRGWVVLDAFSASAIVTVFDALNEANRERYSTLTLTKMAHVAFKILNK